MHIDIKTENHVTRLDLKGRFDNFGAGELKERLDRELGEDVLCAALSMCGVDYMSSAALRVLLVLHKTLSSRGGTMVLAALQPYCQDVIEMTGFANAFEIFSTMDDALAYCRRIAREHNLQAHWDQLETADISGCSARIIPASEGPGTVHILGDVRDVLHSRVTEADMSSKRFFDTEYSIGMGGLGGRFEDYFGIMGEMITIGGTMVWLPTDGHDTPDFLIPRTDKGDVMIRTAYNVSIAGDFHELIYLRCNNDEGLTITDLYRGLFDMAKSRRPDFMGVIGLAMRAQMKTIYGSGIKKSAVAQFAPPGGKLIIDPEVVNDWFDFDKEPRHRDVTALVVGVGADLTADLSGYNADQLNRVFYLNPANTGGKTEMMHNHAVVFDPLPMSEHPVDFDEEVRTVVRNGDFIDMRHLLDSSRISAAFIGISYISEFLLDTRGTPMHSDGNDAGKTK